MKNPPTPFRKEAGKSSEEIQEQIRERAYALYEKRAKEDGHDLDDWLRAEAEVTQKKPIAA